MTVFVEWSLTGRLFRNSVCLCWSAVVVGGSVRTDSDRTKCRGSRVKNFL